MTPFAKGRYDRLSAYDWSYLQLESALQPLHSTMQLNVEGHVPLEDVRAQVQARLGEAPALLKRVRYPLLAGPPVWVDEPHFDLDAHVFADDRPGESPADTLKRLTTTRLPRSGPMWQLRVTTSESRTHLWLSAHHSFLDGGVLNAALFALFGPVPAEGVAPVSLSPAPSRGGLLARHVVRRVKTRGKPKPPPVRRGPGPVSGERAFARIEFTIADLKAAGAGAGATLNDVYLAVVSMGLRAYLDAPRDVLAIVPRGTRLPHQAKQIGNRHVAMLVDLPVTSADPRAVLDSVHSQMASHKATGAKAGPERVRSEIVITNVRLDGDHSVAGHRVLGYQAGLPLLETKLAVQGISYAGTMALSFTADASVFPDPERLAAATEDALKTLHARTS